MEGTISFLHALICATNNLAFNKIMLTKAVSHLLCCIYTDSLTSSNQSHLRLATRGQYFDGKQTPNLHLVFFGSFGLILITFSSSTLKHC